MVEEEPFLGFAATLGNSSQARRCPPNRMNDLAYRDWMKFQKSFFWDTSSQSLAEDCIYFFTKALWPDGSPSRSLVLGFDDFDASTVLSPRIVDIKSNCSLLSDVMYALHERLQSGKKYDFILIDLRRQIADKEAVSKFLADYSDTFFHALRQLLIPKRYCSVVVSTGGQGGVGFPIPWAVALSCRNHLKLRDEKIGLVAEEGNVYYCLFMQAEDDGQPAKIVMPSELNIATVPKPIPAWTIPRPPPRKKNEILHPAKYPETLVAEFIELFTQPGDSVFDPMVGTGSTVVAAMRASRHGFGVDIVPEFVEIARGRIENENAPMLFAEMRYPSKSLVVQGDAIKLNELDGIAGLRFDYSITSPPYWSMLTNPGSEYQEDRRRKNLRLVYSNDERDLGNVLDYRQFLALLENVYNQVASRLVDNGCLTVVVKNVKRGHVIYPLAWDLVLRLCRKDGSYDYLGTTLWCQDDVGIKPFAVGIQWVSNTLHHYCLHFTKRKGVN